MTRESLGRVERPRVVVIENVRPELDDGRNPVKRIVGERLEVTADIFKHGHDLLAAAVKFRAADEDQWRESPMRLMGKDRWRGRFSLARNIRYSYTIEAWPDAFASWSSDLQRRVRARQDSATHRQEGAYMVRAAAQRAQRADVRLLLGYAKRLDTAPDGREALRIASEPRLRSLARRYADRSLATQYDRTLEVVVDRPRARFAAWYELFPRSQGTTPGRSGTLRDVERRLPELQRLGFDVLYFPPIHPIGETNRKGPNNTMKAGPDDPGSPYAVGSAAGGHAAVHPELGTLEDFDHLVRAARRHGLEIALDLAFHASPDHPWVRDHPEWFNLRPDGSIKFAENPPKRYEDIYPFNFTSERWRELWRELKQVVLFWVTRGVRTFRVDNPHTKPVQFWEWLIREVQAQRPDVVFLSEAFTGPRMMKALAKVGFTQSYTYFTWRNTKQELVDYFTELAQPEMCEYFRGNLFTNTPDILSEFLQTAEPPAFKIRLVLAGTLSPLYGIYSGFELCENRAVPRTEVYQDSEMYQHKVWDWDRPGNIKSLVQRVNSIRRENPALQLHDNLQFHRCDNDNLLFYSKCTPGRENVILVVVNLDSARAHAARVHVPCEALGIGPKEPYRLHDLLTGERYRWTGESNRVRLDPKVQPAHIFRLER